MESSHRYLKEAVDQALLLRGHRDFDDRPAYDEFVRSVVMRRNRRNAAAFQVEREYLQDLPEHTQDRAPHLDSLGPPGQDGMARTRRQEPAADRDKLDYWVSRAERIKESAAGQDAPLVVRPYVSDPTLAEAIIAREHIAISHIVDAELGDMSIAWIEPAGNTDRRRPGTRISMSDTNFEAAMLCHVSACFGDALPIYTEHPAPDPGSSLN